MNQTSILLIVRVIGSHTRLRGPGRRCTRPGLFQRINFAGGVRFGLSFGLHPAPRLVAYLGLVFVIDFPLAGQGYRSGLQQTDVVNKRTFTPTGDRTDQTIQPVERLLSQHNAFAVVLDADTDGQVFAAVACIAATHDGLAWQCGLDHPIKDVVDIGRAPPAVYHPDNFLDTAAKAIVMVLAQTDRGAGLILSLATGRLFDVHPGLGELAFPFAIGAFDPATLNRALRLRRTNGVGLFERLDIIRAGDAALFAPIVIFVDALQRQILLTKPVKLGLVDHEPPCVVNGSVGLSRFIDARRFICVIPLLMDDSVEAIKVTAGFDPLDVDERLRGLIGGLGTELILITSGRLVDIIIGRHRFTQYTPQAVVDITDFHVVVVAIEQGFAVEQRILQGNDLLRAIEAGHGLYGLQHSLAINLAVRGAVGILCAGCILAHDHPLQFEPTVQKCVVRLIEIFIGREALLVLIFRGLHQ